MSAKRGQGVEERCGTPARQSRAAACQRVTRQPVPMADDSLDVDALRLAPTAQRHADELATGTGFEQHVLGTHLPAAETAGRPGRGGKSGRWLIGAHTWRPEKWQATLGS